MRTSWMNLALGSWMLGMEASTVIASRLSRLAAGDAKAMGDSCDLGIPRGRTLSYPPLNAVPAEEELLQIRSHDFH
jgi:hypothetical protein